jgi:acetyl/propionyl-CoA carboxylase alpha subunit
MIYRYQVRGRIYEINLERDEAGYRATIDGQPYSFEIMDDRPGALSLRFDGRPQTVYWAADGGLKWISLDGCTYRLEKPASRSERLASTRGAGEASLRAPMPAQVRAVQVMEGDRVEKGQTLILLEAMKMEIRLQAPIAGRVAHLAVAEGQPVERDQVLVEIEDAGQAETSGAGEPS